jgi:hypothetical protein
MTRPKTARAVSKFGVRQDAVGKAERTYKGVLYHSRAEASYAAQLDLLVKAGEIVRWERQVVFTFPSTLGCPRCMADPPGSYVADFLVTLPDRNAPQEVLEVKGHMTAVAKRKLKLFAALYPHIKLVIIKRGVRQPLSK